MESILPGNVIPIRRKNYVLGQYRLVDFGIKCNLD